MPGMVAAAAAAAGGAAPPPPPPPAVPNDSCCICRCFKAIGEFFKKVGVLTAIVFTASVLVGVLYSVPIALTVFGGYVLAKSIYHLVKPQEARPTITTTEFQFTPDRRNYPTIVHPNKGYVFDTLMQERDFRATATVTKGHLNNVQELYDKPLFPRFPSRARHMSRQEFAYERSDDRTMYWAVNFARSNVFDGWRGPLLGQSERQVSEHPALSLLRLQLENPAIAPLGDNEALLIANVERFGSLNIPSSQFANATTVQLEANLERFEQPQINHIVAMVSPVSGNRAAGALYEQADLEQTFNRAYVAFQTIKERYPDKDIIVQTGNWDNDRDGSGPKLAALMQLAAGRMVGIHLKYHPDYPYRERIDRDIHADYNEYTAGEELFEGFCREHPNWTVREFLNHLFVGRAHYNLRYGAGA